VDNSVDNSKELSRQIDILVKSLRDCALVLEGFGIYIRKGVEGPNGNDRDVVGVGVKVEKEKADRYARADLDFAVRYGYRDEEKRLLEKWDFGK
jgi:hypothetical protein